MSFQKLRHWRPTRKKPTWRKPGGSRPGASQRATVIRLGSLAGYPFDGPRVLGGLTPPSAAAVYAVMYKPDPVTKPENYAVIYVGHADDLSAELFPFKHPKAPCWIQRPAPSGRSTCAPTRCRAGPAPIASR